MYQFQLFSSGTLYELVHVLSKEVKSLLLDSAVDKTKSSETVLCLKSESVNVETFCQKIVFILLLYFLVPL